MAACPPDSPLELTSHHPWRPLLACLQILDERHAPLLELLGRTSGRDVDKLAALAARFVPLLPQPQCSGDGAHPPLLLLGDSCGWMELRVVGEPVPSGDHDVVICEVTGWGTPQAAALQAAAGAAGKAAEQAASGAAALGGAPARPLYTGHLRQLGLL